VGFVVVRLKCIQVDCVTVVLFLAYGIPSLIHALRLPEVKPAFSYRYNFKFLFSLLCLCCSVTLALSADPPSPALRIALTLSALGWFLAVSLLVAGHHRHLPQFTCVRFWWVVQFVMNVLVFLMHSNLHTGVFVHYIRGGYCVCCVLLALLSVQPKDQPLYFDVVLHGSSPSMVGIDSEEVGARSLRQNYPVDVSGRLVGITTDKTPLLVNNNNDVIGYSSTSGDGTENQNGGNVPSRAFAKKGSSCECESTKHQVRRKLSSNLVMTGASTSKYNQTLEAWNEALYGAGERNQEHAEPNPDTGK